MKIVGPACTAMCKLLDRPAKRHDLRSSCLCGRGIGKREEEPPLSDEEMAAFEKYLDGAHDVSLNIKAMRQLFDEVKRSRTGCVSPHTAAPAAGRSSVSKQEEQIARWSEFTARVKLTFPFRVDILVRPGDGHHADQASVGVELHVLERNSREPITVYTRQHVGDFTNDSDALDVLFELIGTALVHETHESVWLDGKLARELHKAVR